MDMYGERAAYSAETPHNITGFEGREVSLGMWIEVDGCG